MRATHSIVIPALLLTMLVSNGQAASAAISADSIEKSETVVILSAERNAVHIGAGVVVSRDGSGLVVVTAAHVVSSGGVTVAMPSGERLAVTKIDAIPGFDLALLHTSAYVGPVRLASFGRPTVGAAISVWGHRIAHPYVESTGSVVDLDPALPEGPADGRFAITCDACDHGDSGGGVFDADGRLVGILEGARRDDAGHVAFVQCEPVTPLATTLAVMSKR